MLKIEDPIGTSFNVNVMYLFNTENFHSKAQDYFTKRYMNYN